MIPAVGKYRSSSLIKALLHFDGTNGSTTFTDQTGRVWTPSGSAQLSTAQKKFGTASGSFQNNTDYISASMPAASGDFTIEGFAYLLSSGGLQFMFDGRPSSTNGIYPTIYFNAGVPHYYVSGNDRIIGGSAMSASAWHHVAVSRTAGVTKMFVDGVQAGSNFNDSGNYLNTSLTLGTSSYLPSSAAAFGYIDEVRVTLGLGRYTANFTPPSSPFTYP